MSSHNSDSVRKYERPNTASKGERHEASSHYYFRNSSNNSKVEKPRTSETKSGYNSHSYLNGKSNISSSFHEEDERLKKKSSLK